MELIQQKTLLRDIRDWIRLQEELRVTPLRVPLAVPDDAQEVDLVSAVEEMQERLEAIEERLSDFNGAKLLKFMHTNRHMIEL